MFKKLNGPLGIALTVAGVVLALSPEARRSVRKLLVKSTAGMMDAMEGMAGIANGLAKQSGANTQPDVLIQPALPQAGDIHEGHPRPAEQTRMPEEPTRMKDTDGDTLH